MDSTLVNQLKKGYANNIVSKTDIVESYTRHLCGNDGLTLEDIKNIANMEKLSDLLSVDEYKEVIHKVLKFTMKKNRQNITVEFDNDVFDANESAQDNMMVLLKSFDMGAETAYVRSTSETTHAFSRVECNRLAGLMLSAVQNLYSKYWSLKDNLAACTTYEELEKFDTTWPE